MKRAIVVFVLIFCLAFGGCYSYKGLDKMIIVMGIALDYDEQSQKYLATLEIVDIPNSSEKEGIKNKMLECEGVSIPDAFFNATKKIRSILYFGSCEVLIICPGIAQKGLKTIIDTFVRTQELRETAFIMVSQEEKAGDLFKKAKGMTSAIISMDIQQIMEQGSMLSGTIKKVKMYQVYNDLLSQKKCPSIPALHLTGNDQEKVVEANGTAVFRIDKLKHYLTPEETIFLLLATNEYGGGSLMLDKDGDPANDFCILVRKAISDTSLKIEEDKPSFGIDIKLRAVLDESELFNEKLKHEELKQLEEDYARMIEEKVKNLLDKVQKEYNCDIVGFGEKVYRENPKFWEKIKDKWFEIYADVKVDVKASVKITNINITR